MNNSPLTSETVCCLECLDGVLQLVRFKRIPLPFSMNLSITNTITRKTGAPNSWLTNYSHFHMGNSAVPLSSFWIVSLLIFPKRYRVKREVNFRKGNLAISGNKLHRFPL